MHVTLIVMCLLAMGAVIACSAMALTTEPNLRQANSLYADISMEDLMDMVDRVDPAATPVYSLARREYELGNTEFAWEVDSWPGPNGALGPGDGYAVQTATETRNVVANIRKMGNYGEAFRRVFGSGWIANAVPRLPGIGKGKLLARGAADAMVLLKQDIEVAACSFDQTATPDQGGATGSLMAGIRKLVDSANAYASPTAFAFGKPTDLHSAPTGAVLTGAMATVFNLAAIRTMAQALRVATARNKDYAFLCGLNLRAQVTALVDPQTVSATGGALAATQVRMFKQEMADAELGISIDVIRTDWGRWLVLPTDFIGNTMTDATGGATTDATRSNRAYVNKPNNGLLLSREKLFKRWGVGFETDQLANDGGGTTKQVRCYVSIGVGNPVGFGFLSLT